MIMVLKVMFSGDGYYLYSGARCDDSIICWDIRSTAAPVYHLQRETTSTNQRIHFDIEPIAGRHLATGGECGRLRVFDLSTGEQRRDFQISSDVLNGVDFHPWKPQLATSSGQRHYLTMNEIPKLDNALKVYTFATN